MVEIKLIKDFLLVKETLERIGIANQKTKVLTPSCYLIFKNKKYYIAHFKTLIADKKNKNLIGEQDINRRDSIISMLKNWGMIEILEDDIYQEVLKEKIFVLTHDKKKDYTINHKYEI